jgi:hypothetical protein
MRPEKCAKKKGIGEGETCMVPLCAAAASDKAVTTPLFAARAGVGLLFQTSGDGKIVVKEVVKGGSAARSGQVRGARAPKGREVQREGAER